MKRVFSLLMIFVILFVLSAATPIKTEITDTSVEVVSPVLDVIDNNDKIAENVLKARFENMLNNNFLYDDDFTSHRVIIENSILALLDKSIDGEIDKTLVLGFIADMYGLQVDESACVYDFLPASDGMFAIIPRGYSEYKHFITDVVEDEAGYTVYSNMTEFTHDGEEYIVNVKTEFVVNDGSSFGYNIINSEII